MAIQFSYKLTDTNIYAHLLYRIHDKDAAKIDGADLLDALTKAAQLANNHLQHTDCNIVVYADPENVIPEEGVGGLSLGSDDWIRIDIDPDTELGLKKVIQKQLPGMVAHELHHARRAKTVGYGDTLGEALVTEGLAQAYQEFLYPKVDVLYAHHLTRNEMKQAWKLAEKKLDSDGYNHAEWFFGAGTLKRWAGYSLGYDIVLRYMQEIGENNPAKLVDVPAKKFLVKYDA